MASIPRKTQKLFGSALTPTGNVAIFGSLAAGAPAFSNDPDDIQSLAAFLNGLNGEVVGNRSPAIEDLNGLFLLFAQQIAYILQKGVAEYDAATTYYIGGFCQIAGVMFVSKTNNNTGNNPLVDANNWNPFVNSLVGPSVCAAWAEFDGINVDSGGNSIIHGAFNVDHVRKNAAGNYTVNFATALRSPHYALGGSCGSEDGQPYGAGDNGVLVGNVAGQGNAVRSVNACRIFTINPSTLALVASGDVSVFFFGL